MSALGQKRTFERASGMSAKRQKRTWGVERAYEPCAQLRIQNLCELDLR